MSEITQKVILVTGAGGYIGSIMTYMLLQQGYRVIALDNYSTGYREPLSILCQKYQDRIELVEADVRDDLSAVLENKSIDGVLHLASPCDVDESARDPQKYIDNIENGTSSLIQQMRRFGVRKIIFSSTCAVYGEPHRLPITESHPLRPKSQYGMSKLNAEDIIVSSGMDYLIFRYFNVCGTSDDCRFGDSKRPSTALIQNAVRGALGIAKFKMTCPNVNTKDKTPIRDYIDVADLSWAHILGLEYLFRGGPSDRINLGAGRGYSVLEIVKKVESATSQRLSIEAGTEPRQGEIKKIYASAKKANKLLGWRTKYDISLSINNLVKWYSKRPQGWQR